MTSEADLCSYIRNTFLSKGECIHKIPDPSSRYTKTIKRPFDMIGTWKGNPLYLEAKFQRKIKSFNLKRIEEHQMENLLHYKEKCFLANCWIALGISVGRMDSRVYFFSIDFIHERFKKKKNILGKELKQMPYYVIRNNNILIENDIDVITN